MDELSRSALIACRSLLHKDLKVEYVLSDLISDGILRDEDVEIINHEITSPQRADKLLDILPSKGPDAFNCFVNALTEAEYEHLADLLVRKQANPTRKRHFSISQIQAILVAGGVPPPPNVLANRIDYKSEIISALSKIVETPGWVMVHGMGGSGKSVLAADTVKSTEVLSEFPGGVFWASIGKIDMAKLLIKMQNLCLMLNPDQTVPPRNIDEAKNRLRKIFSQQYPLALLILDDVWSQQVARAFDIQARILVTTRDEDVCKRVSGHVYKVHIEHGLNEQQALKILSDWTDIPVADLPPEAHQIYEECSGMPFALSLIGALLKEHDNRWQYYLRMLQRRKTGRLSSESSYQYATINEAISISVNNLEDEVREYYKDLAIFDSDILLPTMVFCVLWNEEKEFVEDTMDILAKKSLLTKVWNKARGTFVYSVHGLHLDYLKNVCDNLPNLHANLINKYKQYSKGEYNRLPRDGYIHSFICHHVFKANMLDELPKFLFDLQFIDVKLQVAGPSELINDYMKYGPLMGFAHERSCEEFAHFVSSNAFRYASSELPDIVQLGLCEPSTSSVYEEALKIAQKRKSEHLYFDWCNRDKAQSPVFLVTKLHSTPVKSVQFSLNGHNVLSSCQEEVKVFDRATGKELLSLEPHKEEINGSLFSTDCTKIATYSEDKTLKLYKVPETLLATPSPPLQPNGYQQSPKPSLKNTKWHPTFSSSTSAAEITESLFIHEFSLDSSVMTCAFSPDHSKILGGGVDGEVVVFSLEKMAKLYQIQAHERTVCASDFSFDGKYFATCGHDLTVKMWTTTSGKEVYLSEMYRHLIMDCKFIPNSHKLAYCSNNEIHICDPLSGKCESCLKVSNETVILSLAITNDGSLLSAGLSNFTIQLFSLESRKLVMELKGNSGWVETVCFNPDGRQLVSGGSNETVTIWNISMFNEPKSVSFKKDFDVNFLEDNLLIAAVDAENKIQILEGEDGRRLFHTPCERTRIRCVAITSDCTRVAYGQESGLVKVLNMVDRKFDKIDVFDGHKDAVRFLRFSTDDSILATCSDDFTIKLWNGNGQSVTCTGHTGDVRRCHFVNNNAKLVSSSFDGHLKVWSVADGKLLRDCAAHHGEWILASDVSKDGKLMVSASVDRTLKVWNVDNGCLINVLNGHHDCVRSCVFDGDDRFVVSGDDEGFLRLWKKEKSWKFSGRHSGWVTDIKVSEDGKTVVSVSDSIRWWDASGKLLQTFNIHGSFCRQIKASPDFKKFVTIDSPGTMYIVKAI